MLTCSIQSATGVLGDAKDLGALLEWAKMFWRVLMGWDYWGHPEEPWAQEIRLSVAASMETLSRSFTSMEQAHRTLHRLTGDESDDESDDEVYVDKRKFQW